MHPDYDHFGIYSINFQTRQISITNQQFSGNNNPISIKSTIVWVKIFEKRA